MHHRGRAVALTAAALLTVVALAGCAPAQADSAPIAAPPTTASPSPSPAGTPKAAIGNVPTDPSSWIIEFDSLAGVRVGDAIAPFAQSAGLERQQDTADCPNGYFSSADVEGEPDNLLTTSFMDAASRGSDVADPAFTLGMVVSRFSPDHVQPGSPMTAAGIRVGSTEAELLAAYPDLQKGRSKYDEGIGARTYFVGPQNGRYLVFNVRPSEDRSAVTVNTIQTSTYPSIVDVCD